MKNKVQILREEKNITQNQLAERSGLSLRTIQRIEAGRVPKGFTLKSLAKALEVEADFFCLNKELSSEINRVKLINIWSLSFLILPFGNIIIPAILTYKSKNSNTKELGKSILSIQIIWTIITCVLMIVSPFIQKQFHINAPLFIIFLIFLISINILVTLKNAISLNQKADLYIKLKNNIL